MMAKRELRELTEQDKVPNNFIILKYIEIISC